MCVHNVCQMIDSKLGKPYMLGSNAFHIKNNLFPPETEKKAGSFLS